MLRSTHSQFEGARTKAAIGYLFFIALVAMAVLNVVTAVLLGEQTLWLGGWAVGGFGVGWSGLLLFGIDVENHDCHGFYLGACHTLKSVGIWSGGLGFPNRAFRVPGGCCLPRFKGFRCILRVSNQISGKRVPSPEVFGSLQGYLDPPAQEV